MMSTSTAVQNRPKSKSKPQSTPARKSTVNPHTGRVSGGEDREAVKKALAASPGAVVDSAAGLLHLSLLVARSVYRACDEDCDVSFRVAGSDDPDAADGAEDRKNGFISLSLDVVPLDALFEALEVFNSERLMSPDDRRTLLDRVNARIGEDIRDLHGLFYRLLLLQQQDKHGLGVRLNGRVHPVELIVRKYTTRSGVVVVAYCKYRICDIVYTHIVDAWDAFFRESDVVDITYSTAAALDKMGLVQLTAEHAAEHARRAATAREIGSTPGAVLSATGSAYVMRKSMFSEHLVELPFGTAERPALGVAEPTFESRVSPNTYNEEDTLPLAAFVRLFDFKRRAYVYVDVDDLAPYDFDEQALDKLSAEPEYRELLRRIFSSPEKVDSLGDLIRGKNGGVIILASGPSGTGKTMTAECVAQITRRPLYTVGLADLGTDMATINGNLDHILQRAERWNAVLLIDEADVLLTKRGEDLGRSAIVSLFLHRIEYYSGFLFLTSNLPEQLDPAVLSRVTLHRRYAPHDASSRAAIWRRLIDHSGLVASDETVDAMALHEIDGRNIRSVVKLARMLHPAGSTVSAEEFGRLLVFSAVQAAE